MACLEVRALRRAEVNAGSQPVRNLATNPSFETLTGSSTTVRTNLCAYPNMSATGSAVTVRTNRIINPLCNSGWNTRWSGGGTASTAYTFPTGANPAGTSQYVRKTWTAGGGITNGDCGFDNAATARIPVTAGGIYTLSGYLRPSVGDKLGNCSIYWEDAAGVFLTRTYSNNVTMTANQWTQVSMTATAPANAAKAYMAIDIATGGATLWQSGDTLDMCGPLFELGPLGTFFSGGTTATADFTYLWTGTVNASSSQEQGVLVSGWSNKWFGSGGGAGVAYKHSTDSPIDGPYFRKVWIVANPTGSQDTGFSPSADIAVTAGKTYTFSVYARSSVSQHMSIFVTWKDSGGATISTTSGTDLGTLTPNTWQRFSITLTAPALTTTVIPSFGPYINAIAMPAGATLDFDQCLIEEGTLGSFFTGNYPASGDFTYTWAGTANASASYRRGLTFVGNTNGGATAIASTDWKGSGGTYSARLTPSSSITFDTWFAVHGDTGAFRMGMEPGKTYTATATSRLTGAQSGTLSPYARMIKFFYKLADGTYTSAWSTAAPNSAGVTKHSVTVTLPVDSTEAFVRLMNGASAGNGEVWWDDFMLVEGSSAPDYVDGTKPFSKWDGTANASTSVGYPQQLLDIAGKPDLEQIGVGLSTNPTVDGFVARTVYVVYETLNTNDTSWQTPFYYGNAAPTVGLTMQTAAAGNFTMSPRLDFTSGGDVNKGFNFPNGRTLSRRHVLAMSFNQGLTTMAAHGDGTALTGLTGINPGSVGWTSGQLRNYDRTDIKTIYSMIFYAEHDTTTRLAISRYLGNKYGANVA